MFLSCHLWCWQLGNLPLFVFNLFLFWCLALSFVGLQSLATFQASPKVSFPWFSFLSFVFLFTFSLLNKLLWQNNGMMFTMNSFTQMILSTYSTQGLQFLGLLDKSLMKKSGKYPAFSQSKTYSFSTKDSTSIIYGHVVHWVGLCPAFFSCVSVLASSLLLFIFFV